MTLLAFRVHLVYPGDFEPGVGGGGLQHEGKYYFCMTYPMGCSLSCRGFASSVLQVQYNSEAGNQEKIG